MFFFKACPKCHGDMYIDRDSYGPFVECLQCGLLRDLKVTKKFVGYSSDREAGEALAAQPHVLRLSA